VCQVHSWVDKKGVRHYSSAPPENMQDVTDYRMLEGSAVTDQAERPVESKDKKAFPDVVIYTTSWCSVCKKTKAWFSENGVPYQEYDVEKSRANYMAYQQQGGKGGVPFIIVGENKMEGFDEALMRNWLGMKK